MLEADVPYTESSPSQAAPPADPTVLTNDEAEALMVTLRWPDGIVCTHCGSGETYRILVASIRRWRYKCRTCRKQFSVTKGTILEGSKLTLANWVKLVYLVCQGPEGMSVADLGRELGVSYKAAQNALDRLCYAMKRPPLADLIREEKGENR